MTDLRAAAHQALEALDAYSWEQVDAARTALRAALAEPNSKPLAEWQITDLMANIDPEDVCSWSFRQGVYAAEKHHGIRP